MSDLIHLLPDNIANQIAAGEVIQRPASAVKELMENAVDAGADEIRLIINDAGKSLVQVIDNGKGMSETDARMSFERHATSKISHIDDLFRIRTMGFRGEALASIAAVAQVELRSRRAEDTLGTFIEIDNSQVKKQEPCSAPSGTSFSMKNLFFNVPARRNFLKSNASEMRHIVDEFIRIALAFPELFFSLTSNGQEVFHLAKGTLKQRIVQIMGSAYASKLVGVMEKTDYLNIYGFVGKPDSAKKTRGDQYLFVNNRFIKSAYLNHAVMHAYQDMVPDQSFPLYVLFIDLDPAYIDINVHPTKQEIKFEDEKIIYAFVQAAVKHALAQYSVTPTLDFELDPAIQQLDAVSKPFSTENKASASASHLFQTFTQQHQAHRVESRNELQAWRSFYEPAASEPSSGLTPDIISAFPKEPDFLDVFSSTIRRSPLDFAEDTKPVQMHQSFILLSTHTGITLVHQQLAHERVVYERLSEAVIGNPIAVQRSLFPATCMLSPSDTALMEELIPDLKLLGYLIEPFGKNSFVIQGTPADIVQGTEAQDIEKLLEAYKHFKPGADCPEREKLIRTMASRRSIKTGTSLSEQEMRNLIKDLSACKQPNLTISGNPTFIEFGKDYLENLFNRH